MSIELLSVVVPAFNEAETIDAFHQRLATVLNNMGGAAEIWYVNDGSTDETLTRLNAIRKHDFRVGVIELSRNFGKEIALTAGLDHANGDVVVVIDADLQDPPELIEEMVEQWQQGYDVVYATRNSRKGESWLKRATASAFYRIMGRVGEAPIPKDTGDFRLMSRPVVDALGLLRERNRFMKGLFSWVGFKQTSISYERDPRHAGTSKWSYWRLWNFALDGITSFTAAPLKAATYLGLIVAISAFVYGCVIIVQKIFYGNPVPGYPSLMVVILFLGGVQLIVLGIIGEYLGRLFRESKQRPLYLIRTCQPPAPTEHGPHDC